MLKYYPNFLIPGAGKSGTTSLAFYLSQHPDVFIATPKEPNFFTFANNPPTFRDLDGFLEHVVVSEAAAYERLFERAAGHKAVGEASTYYLLLEQQSIANIRRFVPDHRKLKIIIILRNPVARAFSNYMMFKLNEAEDLSFEEAISPEVIEARMEQGWAPSFDYLDEGLYLRRVKAYMEEFPRTKVFLYDDLVKDPLTLVRAIFEFLEVAPDFVPSMEAKINVSGHPRSQTLQRLLKTNNLLRRTAAGLLRRILDEKARVRLKSRLLEINLGRVTMAPQTRSRLMQYYRDDVRKLGDLIGRNLSHWVAE